MKTALSLAYRCSLLIIFIAASVPHSAHAQNTIKDTDFITDNAGILSKDDKYHVSSYHNMMLEKYDIDYRVISTKEEIDVDIYANKEFRDKNIGSRSKTLRGLLLVIDMASDQVRLEVSGNLESVFTDAFVGYIEKRQMVQFFRLGRVGDGIFATSELLRIRAEEAKQGQEFDSTKFKGSIGGGARTKARIDAGRDNTFVEGQPDIAAADTPEETLKGLYLSLKKRNGRSDLDIFTPEARKHMAEMVRTPAQMDNTYKLYKKCKVDRVVYSEDGQRAVLLHDLTNRSCDPFTFDKGPDNKWRLNLKAIGTGLGHTYGNVWYLHYGRQKESGLHNYYFGFKDYYFRRHSKERFRHQGFPEYHSWGVDMGHVYLGSTITKIHGEDSYAHKIGLRERDIIVRWEGLEYPHTRSISSRMERGREGLDVDIVILRNGERHHMFVKTPPKPKPGGLRWGVTYHNNGPYAPLVHYVTPGSQADKLGLKPGDFIISWNDLEKPFAYKIYKQIRNAKPGEPVTLEVIRDKETIRLTGTVQQQRKMAKVQ